MAACVCRTITKPGIFRRVPTPTLLPWGIADPRVTRAETATIFAHLAGPKQRVDFVGAGHEPYWPRHPRQWQEAVARFLAKRSGAMEQL